jgi:hypothetical protein
LGLPSVGRKFDWRLPGAERRKLSLFFLKGALMHVFRRPGVVSTAVFLSLTLSFATAHAVAPQWSRDAGLDVWNLPALNAELKEATEERSNVVEHEEQSAKRRETANHIAMKLADGFALSEGADELVHVFQNERGMIETLKAIYPDVPSLRHLFALHAIDRVKRVTHDPVRCEAAVARLEAEYKMLEDPADSRLH